MHELPIVEQVLKTVLKHADGQKVSKITAIHLEIGKLSDLENEWIQRYFDYLSKDTIAEGAQLKIERIPAKVKCSNCSNTYEVDIKNPDGFVCPSCGGKTGELVSGRQYFIKSMEVL